MRRPSRRDQHKINLQHVAEQPHPMMKRRTKTRKRFTINAKTAMP
jgi:hypothetical protein